MGTLAHWQIVPGRYRRSKTRVHVPRPRRLIFLPRRQMYYCCTRSAAVGNPPQISSKSTGCSPTAAEIHSKGGG